MSSDFKKCPNGHYYQGDHCPFCKTSAQCRTITVGRSSSNDCVIVDPQISRFHCQIMQDELGQYSIIDLNSKNGTYVNGKKITERTRLNPLDSVIVGGKSVTGWVRHFGGEWGQPLGGCIVPPDNWNEK